MSRATPGSVGLDGVGCRVRRSRTWGVRWGTVAGDFAGVAGEVGGCGVVFGGAAPIRPSGTFPRCAGEGGGAGEGRVTSLEDRRQRCLPVLLGDGFESRRLG